MARESASADETDGSSIDVDTLMENDAGEDKTFAAMGVAKTIGTVRIFLLSSLFVGLETISIQIISSVDSSPEILSQIQEIIIPVVIFTLERKLLGMLPCIFSKR